jgi:hypothetical protein
MQEGRRSQTALESAYVDEEAVRVLRIHTLDKRWHDRDEILLHAAFQVLADFVEQEQPDRTVDWNTNEVHKHVWEEIQSLYRWWRETRPARQSPLDQENLAMPPLEFSRIPGSDLSELGEPDREKYAEYYRALEKDAQLEEEWYEEDQRNPHRLVEIRDYLWT